MSKQELLDSLKTKIKDIEKRPHAQSMLTALTQNKNEPVQVQDQDPQMQQRLNWEALKRNLCPKCAEDLTWTPDKKFIKCSVCDFKINTKRFSELTRPKIV